MIADCTAGVQEVSLGSRVIRGRSSAGSSELPVSVCLVVDSSAQFPITSSS